MPGGNDDAPEAGQKPHLTLVNNSARPTRRKKASNYSRKEKRLLGLFCHLYASRSLINGYVSASRCVNRSLPKIEFLMRHAGSRILTQEMRAQFEMVTVLHCNVQNRMQTIADFSGSPGELVVLMKRESQHISGAARRLKAIEQYLAEAVGRNQNCRSSKASESEADPARR
jgi:hypothetical protein